MIPAFWLARQVKICATVAAGTGSRTRRVLVRPWAALAGTGCGTRCGGVPVGRAADVPPGQGVLTQSVPGFLLDLEPEPFRDALLDPPDQDGGGVDAFDVDGLVGGEQRDPGVGQFLLQLERVERVPPGPLDVFAHHHGEPGAGAGGFGQQVGQPAVAGDADVGEQFVGGAVAALLQVQAAGLDVPVPGGDEPPGGQVGLHFAGLPAQRRYRVLHDQGGGPAGERDRDRPGAGQVGGSRWWRCAHCRISLIASAWRASTWAASGPSTTRTVHLTFSPPVFSIPSL